MKNRWQLIIVLPFFLSGCMARHVVVLPQEAKGLSDTQWKISQEPSLTVEPPDLIEGEKDLVE